MGILIYSTFMLHLGDWSLSNFSLHYWIGGSIRQIYQGEPGLLRNAGVLRGTRNSITIGIVAGFIMASLGALLGYVNVRKRGTLLAGLLDRLSFMSMLVPAIAFGAVYLAFFAVERPFMPDLYGTLTVLILISIAKRLPFTAQISTSSMHQLGSELEEAAILQGASWQRRFRTVIFPLTRAGFVAGFLVTLITSVRALALYVMLMTPRTAVLPALSYGYTEMGAT